MLEVVPQSEPYVQTSDFRSVQENAAVLYDAPSKAAKALFVVQRHYPLEVIVNLEAWVKVRDHTGALTWVERKFERTCELVDIVTRVLGRPRPGEKHPATRTFQALRIWVNDELGELARGLLAAESLLAPGGRLVVVTFHSLEDRIVKRFLAERSGRKPGTSRHLPTEIQGQDASFRIVNSKSISPTEQEIAANPRARSARLRTAERTVAAPWEPDLAALGLPEVILGR